MALPALFGALNDVTTCQPARCPDGCDDQRDCVLVAVSELTYTEGVPPVADTTYLLTNLEGGELDAWTWVSLARLTTDEKDAERVLCLGEFVVVVSTGLPGIIRSDDRGTTQVALNNTDHADWDPHYPTCIDGIDQTYILVGGTTGYVYRSLDAARTWETVSAANATAQTLAEIMIARDNPLVAYAVGGLGHVIKTDNGGETWYACAIPSADPLLTLWVASQSHVLVINDDGEIWETTDGGVTWPAARMQIMPPNGFIAGVTHAAITGCGCDVLFMTMSDGTTHKVWRNVDGGASGFWRDENDITGDSFDLTEEGRAVACCNANRAVVVGGTTRTDPNVSTALAALLA